MTARARLLAEKLTRDNAALQQNIDFLAAQKVSRLAALASDLAEINSSVKYSLIGCTVRNTGSGWSVLDDSLHSAINVQSVSVVADPENFKLLLNHSVESKNLVDEKSVVVSLIAVPDETFASMGLNVGASVGTTSSAIRASANLSFRAYGTSIVGDVSAFFANKVSIQSLANNTGFRATVPQLQNKFINIETRHTDSRSVDYAVNIVNDKQFDIVSYADFEGYCFYNGTNFIITTDNVMTTLTATWNTDQLTITHDSCGKTFLSAFLQQVYGGYRPVLVSSGINSFVVKFVNDSGVVQTALSSAFKFYFGRNHKYPCLMPSTESIYINCGESLVYWDDVVSANGNIWILGIIAHEKIT